MNQPEGKETVAPPPPERAPITPGIAWVAYSLAALFVGMQMAIDLTLEDAYITFRYAESLARGEGFAYSARYPTWGTTTPLWTLLLAALRVVGIPMMAAVDLLDALGLALQAVAIVYFARAVGIGRAAPWMVLGWAFLYFVPTDTAGMEYGFFAALSVGSLVAAAQGYWRAGALAAGLAAFTRPDGVLAVQFYLLSWVLWGWREERSRLYWLQAAALMALPPLAWYAVAYLTFGLFTPLTLATRQFETDYLNLGVFGLSWLEFLFDPERVVYLGLASIWGAALALRANWRIVVLLLYPFAYSALYWAFHLPDLVVYYAPPLLVAMIFALAALPLTLKMLDPARRRLRFGLGLAWLVLLFQPFAYSAYYYKELFQPELPLNRFHGVFQPLAEDINRWLPEETVVATNEIGVIGWYLEADLVELGGLVNMECQHAYITGKIHWCLLATWPDIVVLAEDIRLRRRQTRGGLWGSLNRYYVLLATIVSDQSEEVLVYVEPKFLEEHGFRRATAYGNHLLSRRELFRPGAGAEAER